MTEPGTDLDRLRQGELRGGHRIEEGNPAKPTMADAPIMDTINERRLDLIKKTVAVGATNADIASFLELAAKYDLDPFAKEIWCVRAKGKDGGPGKLLMMVGRDGLRKIAQKQGLVIDCDVVRKNDEFSVTRSPDGQRVISHSYHGDIEQRGEIVGAWAEVRTHPRVIRPSVSRGYFFAPMSEFRPTNEAKLKHSPWGAQESVMILAAAERQALRQATPLGGLLAEGEDARIGDVSAGSGDYTEPAEVADAIKSWAPSEELAKAIHATIARAQHLGHRGLSDYGTVELRLKGQNEKRVRIFLRDANLELDGLADDAKDAGDIVDPEFIEEDARLASEARPSEDESLTAEILESRALQKAEEADALEDEEMAETVKVEELRAEAASLHDQAEAMKAKQMELG